MVAGLCLGQGAHNTFIEDLLALQHGKMDLTEVEGTADLLAADTAAQQRQARSQLHPLGVRHCMLVIVLWDVTQ